MKSKALYHLCILTLVLTFLNPAFSASVVEWKMDQSSGSTVDDSTANNNDGTIIGTSSWVAGIKNNCLQLDGATSVLKSSAVNLPSVRTNPWTINMCIYADALPEGFAAIGGFGNQDGFWGEARYIAYSDTIQFWGQGIDLKSNEQLDIGKWQMITITFAGEASEGAFGEMTIYKNGKVIKSGQVSFYEHDCMPQIKIAPDLYTSEWDVQFAGKVDEFSISNTALTSEEINTLRRNIGLLIKTAAWPYPQNGAPIKAGYMAIDPAVVLYWEAPPDVNNPTYDVYFGTTPGGLSRVAQGQTAASFDPLGSTELNENTTYYWRVDVTDPNNGHPVVYTGDVWHFTTWQSNATKVLEWKMDSSSGTAAQDSTANGNNGALVGNPQWVKGLVGNCLEFDGADDSVGITNANNLPVTRTDAWSINMYIYADYDQKGRVIGGFGQAIDSGWGESRYAMCTDNRQFQFWGQSIDVYADTVLELGEWQMVTITYQGSDANDWGEMRVYKDGVEKAYDWVNFWEHNALQQAYLSPGVWGNYFSGRIDEFTIWNGALTPTQITQLTDKLPRSGDINNDGNVNFQDLAILAADWLHTQ